MVRSYTDQLCVILKIRDLLTTLAHIFEVKVDGILDVRQGFIVAVTLTDAAGKGDAFSDPEFPFSMNQYLHAVECGLVSVMIPSLKKDDLVIMDFVNNAVFLGDTTRPGIVTEVFQRLRFSNAFERVAFDMVHQTEYALGYAAVVLCPMKQVFKELILNDGFALFRRGGLLLFRQGPTPFAIHLR